MADAAEDALVANRDRRLALVAIVHDYLSDNLTISHGDLAANLARLDGAFGPATATKSDTAAEERRGRRGQKTDGAHLVGNFLRTGAPGGAVTIYRYFKNIVANESYYSSAREHIKAAIRTVYNFKSITFSTLEDIFSKITDPTKSLVNYSGCWDVVRYSGRNDVGSSPLVIRAAMEVSAADPTEGRKFSTFCIHYRPLSITGTTAFNEVRGTILPLRAGQHMWFIGHENDTNYPLDILAVQNQDQEAFVPSFLGMVKRRQETGSVLSSRVMFLRCAPSTALADLTPKIGTFEEPDFKQRYGKELPGISGVLEIVKSKIPPDGKGCLLL